tara:strand:+ start:383 stop:946 length:564 start_codon:yes stop_codon:yes gene_type:complete
MKLDIPFDAKSALLKSEREVLESEGKKAVELIREKWVGWKYGTQYKKPRKYLGVPGTSRDGWAVRELVQDKEGAQVGITIFNDAVVPNPPSEGFTRGKGDKATKVQYSKKQVGKKYAAYVHRAGKKVTKGSVKNREWVVMRAMLKKDWLPGVTSALRDAIIDNMGKSRTKLEIEANKASETDYLVIT